MCRSICQQAGRGMDLQGTPVAQFDYGGRVRGDDMERFLSVLRHGARHPFSVRRIASHFLVDVRQDRRHAVPTAAAGHAAGRYNAAQFRILQRQ